MIESCLYYPTKLGLWERKYNLKVMCGRRYMSGLRSAVLGLRITLHWSHTHTHTRYYACTCVLERFFVSFITSKYKWCHQSEIWRLYNRYCWKFISPKVRRCVDKYSSTFRRSLHEVRSLRFIELQRPWIWRQQTLLKRRWLLTVRTAAYARNFVFECQENWVTLVNIKQIICR